MHLTSNLSYLLILTESLLLFVPGVLVREAYGLDALVWIDAPLFALTSLSHVSFFLFAQHALFGRARARLRETTLLIPLLIGLSINNGRAVIEALMGIRSGFVRTPKDGTADDRAPAKSTITGYRVELSKVAARFELALGVSYVGCTLWLISVHYWLSVPFACLFAISFLATGIGSTRALLPARQQLAAT